MTQDHFAPAAVVWVGPSRQPVLPAGARRRSVASPGGGAVVWEGLFSPRSDVWRRCRALYAPVAAEIRRELDGDAAATSPASWP